LVFKNMKNSLCASASLACLALSEPTSNDYRKVADHAADL